MVWVIEAKYIDDYKIKVKFNDALNGTIDFEPIIKSDHRKIISDLQNMELFKDFTVELDTITWRNGADFAPEYLHSLVKKSKHVA